MSDSDFSDAEIEAEAENWDQFNYPFELVEALLQARRERDAAFARGEELEETPTPSLSETLELRGEMLADKMRIAALEAENARLTSRRAEDWGGQVAFMNEELVRLEAENAELRAALEET